MITRICILFLLLLGCFMHQTAAQTEEKTRHFYNGARAHYGSMIIHSREIRDIGAANPFGLEFLAGYQATGQESFDACNCYPRTGISLAIWNFDKPHILGNGYIATFYIEPTFAGWNTLYFSLKAALGVAYLTKPYHPETNPYNQSYSTLFSFPTHLGGTLNYRLSQRFNANFTLIYNHISNGGLREPNKGINWPTIALGVDYNPTNFKLIRRITDKQAFKQTDRYFTSIGFFGTGKQLNHSEFRKYFIGGVDLEGSYRVSRLSALTVGGNFEWDETDKEEISRLENPAADHKKIGMLVGHQFLLGKFTFSQSFGVYLYDQYKANDPVYQKYSLMYKLGKRFETGIMLKAHRHVADYLALKASVNF